MQPFTKHAGIVAPLDRVNVDTDQMVPKQFLKWTTREGYGRVLFYDWRYLDGEVPNPEFVLNKPRYKGASILLTRANFGCGSSREHAPWGVLDYGFRVVLAPSFADIFYSNCFKNGILPIALPQADIDKLLDDASRGANATITVDLENQEIRGPDGGVIHFDIDPFLKRCLMEGLDDIGLTMEKADAIAAFEGEAKMRRPWA
jgi:3-isopropylmalate/(R)-2-methylmalate dehydratase small subunit